MSLSCASIRGYNAIKGDLASPIVYGKGMGARSAITPDGVAKWRAKECTPTMVKLTHAALAKGLGSPGMVLFYFRCRGPNDYQAYLKTIKNRWKPPRGRRR